MLLTLSALSTPQAPASNLSFLLHKHPDKLQSFSLPFGQAHLFYPEYSEHQCTLSLLLDVDPINLSRATNPNPNQHLWPYVNDRPYVCSSFMSTTISRVLGTALSGNCKSFPEYTSTPMHLKVSLHNLPVHSGHTHHELISKLFSPLGYHIQTQHTGLLNERFPAWGESPLVDLHLEHSSITLQELLAHIYVLIPVLDNNKHYFVSTQEVSKLLRHGDSWLHTHPEKTWITQRYLKRQTRLAKLALQELQHHKDEDEDNTPQTKDINQEPHTTIETTKNLHQRRLEQVLHTVLSLPSHHRIVDMGCGEGKLLKLLQNEPAIEHIVGIDVSTTSLQRAQRKLRMDELSYKESQRITLHHGSLLYCDDITTNADVITLVEVIEHIEESLLPFAMYHMLGFAKPNHLIITTPNADYNSLFENLSAGHMRHNDHRFEWSRKTFEAWCLTQADTYNYSVSFEPVGDLHPELGAQTQMAVFSAN